MVNKHHPSPAFQLETQHMARVLCVCVCLNDYCKLIKHHSHTNKMQGGTRHSCDVYFPCESFIILR